MINSHLLIPAMIRTHRELWSSRPRSLASGTGSGREPRERWSPGPRPRFPPAELQESREARQLAEQGPAAGEWASGKGGWESVKAPCDRRVNTQYVPYFSVGHARMTVTSLARARRGNDTRVFILGDAAEAERRCAAKVRSEEKPRGEWQPPRGHYKYPPSVPRLCPSPAAGAFLLYRPHDGKHHPYSEILLLAGSAPSSAPSFRPELILFSWNLDFMSQTVWVQSREKRMESRLISAGSALSGHELSM